ncbi:MAG TPA: serine/threonine-protein kinase [Actinoplanes sp.]|nr:serine/threonine-protein kinase [Actinoplanes sp.]
MTSALQPEDPRTLGRYALIERLGEGGMGVVYLGRDPDGTLVAVKVIRAEFARDPNFRDRFRSEVNRAREVPAFSTAEVLDADPDHEPPYLVVEYIDGPSLADVIRDQGPLRGGNLHGVAVGVATALAGIHSAGIVHRDLKPGNVLFALGSPKVIDFGIAKGVDATSNHTQPQQMVGTLSYMSPERFNSGDVTPAADIFAWGAVVAYAATGHSPFATDNPVSTVGRILTETPDLTGLPASLAPVVGRALAKDPGQRPTAQELLRELTAGPSPDTVPLVSSTAAPAASSTAAPAASSAAAPPAPSPGPRSRRRVAIAVAVSTVVLAGVAAGVWASGRSSSSGATGSPDPTGSSVVSAPWDTETEIFDPLLAPALWQPYQNDDGTCSYDGALVLQTATSIECDSGPDRALAGDITIGVDAEMSAGACTSLWFRWSADGENGYSAMVCAEYVSVQIKNDGKIAHTELRSVDDGTLTRLAIEDDGPHPITVQVTGDDVTVSVDGREIMTADLSLGDPAGARHTSGTVTFGALTVNDQPVRVTLRNVHITLS